MRRVALIAFNSAAHNKPSLIRDLLDSILPQLYNETKVRVSIPICICNMYFGGFEFNLTTYGLCILERVGEGS